MLSRRSFIIGLLASGSRETELLSEIHSAIADYEKVTNEVNRENKKRAMVVSVTGSANVPEKVRLLYKKLSDFHSKWSDGFRKLSELE